MVIGNAPRPLRWPQRVNSRLLIVAFIYRNWLKHWDEDKPDEVEMIEILVATDVMRAISKFYVVYGKVSEKMQNFWKWSLDKKYFEG